MSVFRCYKHFTATRRHIQADNRLTVDYEVKLKNEQIIFRVFCEQCVTSVNNRYDG